MWIKTETITVEEEALAMKSSIIFHTAVHADMRSMREGITFVLGKYLQS